MKRLGITMLVVLAVAFFASASQAYTVKMYDAPGSNYSNGGPFEARVQTPVPVGMLGTSQSYGLSFITFCIERSETFNYDTLYNFTLDTFAVNGGIGGQDPPGSSTDPLDFRTAYLYYNFRNGAAYNQVNLQEAIWFIEGELPNHTLSTGADDLVDLATSANPQSLYGVMVMNLGTCNQSMLALVPEPASLLLLGLGLLGIGILRRKQ